MAVRHARDIQHGPGSAVHLRRFHRRAAGAWRENQHGRQRRCLDNVFVERLRRSLKYEEVYLHAYDSVREARVGIGDYFRFYNTERPHQALGYQTPEAYYRGFTKAA